MSKYDEKILNQTITANRDEPRVKGATSGAIGLPTGYGEYSFEEKVKYHRMIYAGLKSAVSETIRLRSLILDSLTKQGVAIDPKTADADTAKALSILGIKKPLGPAEYDMYIGDIYRMVNNSIADKSLDTSGLLHALSDNGQIQDMADGIDIDPSILSAAETIKNAFNEQAIKSNDYSSHLLDMLRVAEAMGSSMIASMDDITTGTDGGHIFDDLQDVNIDVLLKRAKTLGETNSHNDTPVALSETSNAAKKHSDRQKTIWKKHIDDYLKDCIPCGDRFKAAGTALADLKKLEFGKDIREQVLRYMAALLSMTKMTLSRYFLINDICKMVDLIRNSVCLPDLVGVVALLTLMENKIKNIHLNPHIGAGDFTSLLKAITYPVISYIYNLLVTTISTVFSPMFCTIDYMSRELNKISAGTQYIENKGDSYNLFSISFDPAGWLVKTLRNGQRYVLEEFMGITNEVRKLINGVSGATFEKITGIRDLIAIQTLISVVNDLASMMLSQVGDNRFNNNDFCDAIASRITPLKTLKDAISDAMSSADSDAAKVIAGIVDILPDMPSSTRGPGESGQTPVQAGDDNSKQKHISAIANIDPSLFDGFDLADIATDPDLRHILDKPSIPSLLNPDTLRNDIKHILSGKFLDDDNDNDNTSTRARIGAVLLFGNDPTMIDNDFINSYIVIKRETIKLNKYIHDNKIGNYIGGDENTLFVSPSIINECYVKR